MLWNCTGQLTLKENPEHAWGDIQAMKKLSERMLVAVAGGIRVDSVKEALKSGADIIVVGRAITKAKECTFHDRAIH